MSNKEIAKWICSNVLLDDCDHCPQRHKCVMGSNPIEEMLEEKEKGIKDIECVGCSKIFDCPGRNTRGTCVNKV